MSIVNYSVYCKSGWRRLLPWNIGHDGSPSGSSGKNDTSDLHLMFNMGLAGGGLFGGVVLTTWPHPPNVTVHSSIERPYPRRLLNNNGIMVMWTCRHALEGKCQMRN